MNIYPQDSHSFLNYILPIPPFINFFLQVCTHAVSLSVYLSLISSDTHVRTQMPETERKPTELEKHLSQDERHHTHSLHAEPLPTPSRDSAYCSRGLCLADTLLLASLPTPIIAATHLHPFLFFKSLSLFLSVNGALILWQQPGEQRST